MNKKLLSLAIAGAMVAPSVAMAEAVLYGRLNVSLDYAEVKNVILPTYGFARNDQGEVILDDNGNPTLVQLTNGVDFDGWGMSSNGYIPGVNRSNRIGVKGSEDLGNGLKAIYQVELGINLDDTNNNVLNNNDTISYRNTFVGLAGEWGTFLVGRHDTPLKISTGRLDLFSDTMADYNGTVGFRDLRADNVLAYISPSLAGFQFSGAIVPAGGATGGGQGLNLNENSLAGAYSLAGIYSNGPFYASAAYESLGNQHFNTQTQSVFGSNCPVEFPPRDVRDPNAIYGVSCDFQSSDATAWRFGLGLLDWNGFTLTGIYENRDGEPFTDKYSGVIDPTDAANSFLFNQPFAGGAAGKAELWQIQAGYAFGNNMVKAMYGQADYSAGGNFFYGSEVAARDGGALAFNNENTLRNYKVDTWAVGFDHNFSKRTKVYALYTDVSNDAKNVISASEWNGFSLGMMHSF
ncbi:porin [Thiocapsa imhoffii]|uniref:Porin n=1 Tax=Thiocapsa imhoffii TaxID=382777 RepID=A0A9X1B7P4_9GAMM|nr:porin [Thiocapsa imhoffii]MBK1643473.1 porin [Thiocapsa imhoffii]